jgi:hypothetical protein
MVHPNQALPLSRWEVRHLICVCAAGPYISSMKKMTSRPNFFDRHFFALAVVVGSIGPFMHYVLGS